MGVKEKAEMTKAGAKAKTAGAKKSAGVAVRPEVEVRSRAELRAWLEAHHARSDGIWLVTYKKATPSAYVGYEALVEELLCFGWIDGQAGRVDELRSKLLCTPRRPKSAWSKPNKERVERLEKAGLMTPRGRAMVELAKETGTWSTLDPVDALELPRDLIEALARTPSARENYDKFPKSAQKQILEWVLQAKRPETRAKRIEDTVTKAAKNERARGDPPSNRGK